MALAAQVIEVKVGDVVVLVETVPLAGTQQTSGLAGRAAGQAAGAFARAQDVILGVATSTAHVIAHLQLAVFPDLAAQSALDDLLSISPENDNVLQTGFVRLCDAWPYRILHVAAPRGRRGEQLTIE